MSNKDKVNTNNSEVSTERLSNIAVERLLSSILKAHLSERRWKIVKRWLFTILIIGFMGFTFLVKVSELGYEFMPNSKVVAIVPISGVVADGKPASAEAVIPILRKLFEQPNIKGIVLDIKSGGGSPNESERIYKEIERLKAIHEKEVITVCDSMCASAAYMLAIRGDRVYAGEYTMVGSIGAIMAGWDFSDSIKIADAKYRVFASGEYKDLLNPYKPLEDYKHDRLQRLVTDMAEVFKQDVISVRKGKIDESQDLFTGNVWSGRDALKYGLIDEIATLEQAVEKHWPGVKATRFMPRAKQSDFLDRVFGYFDSKIESALGVNDVDGPVRFEFGG